MRAYYEELWERLPDGLSPPDLQERTRFALDNVAPGERVLDLGCGDGSLTAILAVAVAAGPGAAQPGAGVRGAAVPGGGPSGEGSVVGVEVAQAAVDRARQRWPGLRFELVPIDGPLPMADGSFDVVWASEVIEHVADTATWLSEVRRVLVPGGRLLLTTPDHGRFRLATGGIARYSEPLGDHLHLYEARSLRQLLDDFDFGEIVIRRIGGSPGLRRVLLARAQR